MQREITTYCLEMLDPEALRPAGRPEGEVAVHRVDVPCPELNRFFYTAAGGKWYWTDRLEWSYAQWLAYLDRPELETWIATLAGVPAGYVELERQDVHADGVNAATGEPEQHEPEQQVEIAYFGLLPLFTGRGIGGHLLTAAVRRAWEMGVRRVWVHTCTLDSPAALPNYLARGFRVYREERVVQRLAESPPGPWPGALDESEVGGFLWRLYRRGCVRSDG